MTTRKLTANLATIIAAKRHNLAQRKAKTPIEAVRALASMQTRPSPILSTVADESEPIIVIGQVKHTRNNTTGQVVYDPVGMGLRYTQKQVDAISLFTDEVLYDNGLNDLMLVSRAVNLPVISQDYVLDEYEIIEARAAGASALVLSAAVLDQRTLRTLISDTQRNRMTAIVQVHNLDELRYALTLSPHVIGISSDNPMTPEIELDLEATRRMRNMIPGHIRVMIMENLRTIEQAAIVASLDVDAMMVDENVLDSDQTTIKLREKARHRK
jgi:indole-3-glycerol phosphate synthase